MAINDHEKKNMVATTEIIPTTPDTHTHTATLTWPCRIKSLPSQNENPQPQRVQQHDVYTDAC
ncbi:hypothetical protein, unlikely [Trypanosoma brucei brucei TREU927]|uniref:Uncharacterized protein n=1 Tax=Trypanosoma brucei brucei (strain 927/4 GUTat10.1) TaxID=185431 RepID=Q38FL4_TRYB2|nr:hypothetical protein, unlikely [Trypanosoma brucei brucei TREU927]EAN76406.1 hypothetical protein, unlikely [Trypanosoma brucei brucei TREU927]